MFAPKSIQTDHEDLIHDVAYDFYGKRLATCSSDQTVKVWMPFCYFINISNHTDQLNYYRFYCSLSLNVFKNTTEIHL